MCFPRCVSEESKLIYICTGSKFLLEHIFVGFLFCLFVVLFHCWGGGGGGGGLSKILNP